MLVASETHQTLYTGVRTQLYLLVVGLELSELLVELLGEVSLLTQRGLLFRLEGDEVQLEITLHLLLRLVFSLLLCLSLLSLLLFLPLFLSLPLLL